MLQQALSTKPSQKVSHQLLCSPLVMTIQPATATNKLCLHSLECSQVWKGWQFLHRSIASQLKVHDCCQIVEHFAVRLTAAKIQDKVGNGYKCDIPMANMHSCCHLWLSSCCCCSRCCHHQCQRHRLTRYFPSLHFKQSTAFATC